MSHARSFRQVRPTRGGIQLLRLVLIGLSVAICAANQPGHASDYRFIGYYPSWGNAQSACPLSDIPAERLTHIHYAFAKISESGVLQLADARQDIQRPYDHPLPGITLDGNFGELQKLKRRHSQLKTLISVGGWDWSRPFSRIAADSPSRQKFAASCADFVQRYGFDGIDLDWEFPVSGGQFPSSGSRQDRENFVLLLRDVRAALDRLEQASESKRLLTVATPAGEENLRHIDLPQIHPLVDYVNVMTYDLWGSWDRMTNLQAPLNRPRSAPKGSERRNVRDSVQRYLDGGVPAQKLVVGIPLYGRGVQGVADVNRGLFQRHRGPAHGTWGDEMFSFRDLTRNYFDRYPCYWDDVAKAGWLFAPQENGLMISFEDRRSAGLKADYVRCAGLGGIMVWELTLDAPGEVSIVREIHQRLYEQKAD